MKKYIILLAIILLAIYAYADADEESEICLYGETLAVDDNNIWRCVNSSINTSAYCMQGGNCTLDNLAVTGNATLINLTLVNYNITGTVNAYRFRENGTDLHNLFVDIIGDIMTGALYTPAIYSAFYNWTSGDNWTVFNGGILTFNESMLATIYYNATQAKIYQGTITGGALVNTQHKTGDYDDKCFNFSEASGAPALDLRVNFTDVVSFNGGVMRYFTSNLVGEYPIIQLWDYDEGNWEDYPAVGESATFAIIEQPVYDSGAHILNGVVQMRIYKASSGNTNNKYRVDWLAVTKGYGTPSGFETDPLSLHRDGSVFPTGNFNWAKKNLTNVSKLTATTTETYMLNSSRIVSNSSIVFNTTYGTQGEFYFYPKSLWGGSIYLNNYDGTTATTIYWDTSRTLFSASQGNIDFFSNQESITFATLTPTANVRIGTFGNLSFYYDTVPADFIPKYTLVANNFTLQTYKSGQNPTDRFFIDVQPTLKIRNQSKEPIFWMTQRGDITARNATFENITTKKICLSGSCRETWTTSGSSTNGTNSDLAVRNISSKNITANNIRIKTNLTFGNATGNGITKLYIVKKNFNQSNTFFNMTILNMSVTPNHEYALSCQFHSKALVSTSSLRYNLTIPDTAKNARLQCTFLHSQTLTAFFSIGTRGATSKSSTCADASTQHPVGIGIEAFTYLNARFGTTKAGLANITIKSSTAAVGIVALNGSYCELTQFPLFGETGQYVG